MILTTRSTQEMKERGFKRTVPIRGVKYKLPTAEYRMLASKTRKQVFDLAKEAAKETGKKIVILLVVYTHSLSRLDKA
jgi:hypothetical protein